MSIILSELLAPIKPNFFTAPEKYTFESVTSGMSDDEVSDAQSGDQPSEKINNYVANGYSSSSNGTPSRSVGGYSAFFKELANLPEKRRKKPRYDSFGSPLGSSPHKLSASPILLNRQKEHEIQKMHVLSDDSIEVVPNEDLNLVEQAVDVNVENDYSLDTQTRNARKYLYDFMTLDCQMKPFVCELRESKLRKRKQMKHELKIRYDISGIRMEHLPLSFGWLLDFDRFATISCLAHIQYRKYPILRSSVSTLTPVKKSTIYQNDIPYLSVMVSGHILYRDSFMVSMVAPPFTVFIGIFNDWISAMACCIEQHEFLLKQRSLWKLNEDVIFSPRLVNYANMFHDDWTPKPLERRIINTPKALTSYLTILYEGKLSMDPKIVLSQNTRSFIYPQGFSSLYKFAHYMNCREYTLYRNHISYPLLDSDPLSYELGFILTPLFSVKHEIRNERLLEFYSNTADGVWQQCMDILTWRFPEQNFLNKEVTKLYHRGQFGVQMFGLTDQSLRIDLQHLPGYNMCTDYINQFDKRVRTNKQVNLEPNQTDDSYYFSVTLDFSRTLCLDSAYESIHYDHYCCSL